MAQSSVDWDKFTFQRSPVWGTVVMKEFLGSQKGYYKKKGLGDLHILICTDLLPLAVPEGVSTSLGARVASLQEERTTGHAGWKPSPVARNAVGRERRKVVLMGQDPYSSLACHFHTV